MKDQYAGDIGDYGKYALLRALAAEPYNYAIGVNWYLTPGDGRSDGNITDYLEKEYDSLDNDLFRKLKNLFYRGGKPCFENRGVSMIENGGILDNAVFYNEVLDYTGLKPADRSEYRRNWVKRSLEKLGDSDIIFLDPDNGLEVKSVKPTGSKGNKYVTYEEALLYYNQAKAALIIYNHRDRSPESEYLKRFTRFSDYAETKTAGLARLTYNKISVRDYVFIIKPGYINEMLSFTDKFNEKEGFANDNRRVD